MLITIKKSLLGVAILFGALVPSYFLLHAVQPKVDFIVFSFDRPLQLYALLESTQRYVTGLGSTIVIYRSSDQDYHNAYEKVRKAFPWAVFWEQGITPKIDFKPLTLKALYEGSASYVVFAVDDIIVKDEVDLSTCAYALEKTRAYGVYLRLGSHLTDCYSCRATQPVPLLTQEYGALYSWVFARSTYDWGYPNTVDMTVYHKDNVIKDFNSFSFTNPNTLEGTWACLAGRVAQRKGLCFNESKIVNVPLNRVQNDYNNRNLESFTPKELLDLFNQGFKMDIDPLYKIKNKGAHMEYAPTFIKK